MLTGDPGWLERLRGETETSSCESFISRDKYNLVSFIVARKARVKVAWLCLLWYQNEMHLSKGGRVPSSFITVFLCQPHLNDILANQRLQAHLSLRFRLTTTKTCRKTLRQSNILSLSFSPGIMKLQIQYWSCSFSPGNMDTVCAQTFLLFLSWLDTRN